MTFPVLAFNYSDAPFAHISPHKDTGIVNQFIEANQMCIFMNVQPSKQATYQCVYARL